MPVRPLDSSAPSRLPELIAVDQILASEQRRTVLRELADAFFAPGSGPLFLAGQPEVGNARNAQALAVDDAGLLVDGEGLPAVATIYRTQGMKGLVAALAHAAEIDLAMAAAILGERRLDALVVVCRAADFSLPVFLVYAMAAMQGRPTDENAGLAYGDLYRALPLETARRVIRFHRARLA